MYKNHPPCNPPKKQTTKVWRYLDITKLLSILENKALWFANITTLKGDRFEGFLNNATIKNLRQVAKKQTKNKGEKTKETIEQNLALMKQARELLNVSCWHIKTLSMCSRIDQKFIFSSYFERKS
ncbi:MAG: hypothetical protein GF353_21375 [Candidatus Lokiarchaeota archaeon]|nr:hypothetical protein [Candidatus Lokiarchaeota archaeon]